MHRFWSVLLVNYIAVAEVYMHYILYEILVNYIVVAECIIYYRPYMLPLGTALKRVSFTN